MTSAIQKSTLDVTPLGIVLTKVGENDSPSFSADGKKIVFVSRNRKTHAQPQIYFFDLEQLSERRVTYQDGESRNPFLSKDGKKVIYASSTDELKERPTLLNSMAPKTPSAFPPMDLYESDLSGTEIRRLTNRAGFDGSPWPRSDKSILYSQEKNSRLEIWQMNLASKETSPIFAKKDRSIYSLRLSPNGKNWAWIEKTNSNETSLHIAPLNFKEDPRNEIKLTGVFDSVDWFDDEKLYFSGRWKTNVSQIFSYTLKDQCLKHLFQHSSNLSAPQLNPSKEGIVFVSDANGSKNIYYKSLSSNTEGCLTLQSPPVQ